MTCDAEVKFSTHVAQVCESLLVVYPSHWGQFGPGGDIWDNNICFSASYLLALGQTHHLWKMTCIS